MEFLISMYSNDKSAVKIDDKLSQSCSCKEKDARCHLLFLISIGRTIHVTRDMCFPGREKLITMHMCCAGRGTHITRNMCCQGWEHISLGMCFPGRVTHITRHMCFPNATPWPFELSHVKNEFSRSWFFIFWLI